MARPLGGVAARRPQPLQWAKEAMAKVVFPDHLLQHTNGERELEVAAGNFRELLNVLEARWPGSAKPLGKCAVAIDGQIYQDAFLEPLQPNSEVFFMQRIEGG